MPPRRSTRSGAASRDEIRKSPPQLTKRKTAATTDAASASASAPAPAPKRSVGRPPKNKASAKTPSPVRPASQNVSPGVNSAESAASANDMEIDSPEGRQARRGRGRPPKADKGKGRGPQVPSPPAAPANAAPKPRYDQTEYRDVPTIKSVLGHVFVVGTGEFGQLGLGEQYLERKRPFRLGSLDHEGVVDVAVGGMHTLCLTKEGKVWSWGVNDNKALGRGGDETTPGLVEGLDEVFIVRIAAGDSISVAISDEGRVYTWGSFRSAEGLLGFTKGRGTQDRPELMTHFLNVKIVEVAAGVDHVLALTSTGEVYGWGNGEQSQLGRRIIPRRNQQGLIPEKTGLKGIVSIGCGAYHSFAMSKEGLVYAWGLNNFQQCGLDRDSGRYAEIISNPTLITCENELLSGVKQAVGGNHYSLLLKQDGTVLAFGRSDEHALGLPYTVDPNHPAAISDPAEADGAPRSASVKTAIGTPTQIPTLDHVEEITCGATHSLATKGGKIYSWGWGEMGCLGNGSTDDVDEPEPIEGQKIQNYTMIKADGGGQHTVILARPNEWDSNDNAMDTT